MTAPTPTRSPVSDLALRAFAAGIEALRRDFGMTPWDAPGCRVWLGKLIHEDGADPFTAVAFMAKAAQDPAHETPGSVRLSSAREPFRNVCLEHPASSLRTDGTCGGCFADRFEPADYQRNRPDVDVTAKASRCLDAMRRTQPKERQ